MLRTALIFLALIVVLVVISSATLYEGVRSGELNNRIITPFKKTLADMAKTFNQEEISPSVSINSSSSATVKVNINQGTTQSEVKTEVTVPAQVAKACYRYTVTHLDGSTSRLCYSSSDYNQLVNLGTQLDSAKFFYQGDLDAAQRYQDEYDQYHSDVYLGGKASAEKQAQREKDKIGSITLQMQQIEQRGY